LKRNEKILVYAVTGFLAVVLAIAVLFGDDKLPTEPRGTALADMMKAAEANESSPDRSPDGGSIGDPDGGAQSGPQGGQDNGAGIDGGEGSDSTTGGEAVETGRPFALNAVQAPPASEQLAALFGPSEIVGNYRRVIVRRGDFLGRLAERWCGSAAAAKEIRLLNESLDMDRLDPGEPILLPLVDDQELLDAHAARQAQPSPAPGADTATTAGREATYEVKAGDSAWRIATRFVSNNEAPKFIDQLRQLNPQIADIDSLRVGQKLRLPQ